jgi:hypothetical protein
MRLYSSSDTGEDTGVFREVEASRITDNWLFGDLIPGRTYYLDLGTRNVYNVFVALLRSNAVRTPRNWPGRSAYSNTDAWQPEQISSSFHWLG